MSTINKKSRKPYRILTDVKNKVWDELHFLTDAKSVDAADGKDLETKVGAIRGITSSSNVTESGYAVDAAALNTRLGNQEFGFDSDGNFARREVGADTWIPFSGNMKHFKIIIGLKVDVSYEPGYHASKTIVVDVNDGVCTFEDGNDVGVSIDASGIKAWSHGIATITSISIQPAE